MLRPLTDAKQPLSVERRLSLRVKLQFPIEVSGWESNGKEFKDLAKTNDVSKRGCSFGLLRPLRKGELVLVRTAPREDIWEGNHSMMCEVMWVKPSESGYAIGVKNREEDTIWPISFPRSN